MINPYARGIQPEKSTETSFMNDHEEELYELNLEERRSELEENGWIPLKMNDEREVVGHRYLYNPSKPKLNDWVNLSYRINRHGFRGDELPTEPKPRSIMAFGCSNTFGFGMPEGQIWPTLVGNTLKMRCYNMGYPAGSLDKAFRLMMAWIPKIKPKHVFLLEPDGVRYESISHSLGYFDHTANNISGVPLRFEHEDEWILHREKTLRAIHSLCEQFETPITIYKVDSHEFAQGITKLIGRVDAARDLIHPGRNCHIYTAMTMLKLAGYEWDNEKNA